jgi:hypothetical protein
MSTAMETMGVILNSNNELDSQSVKFIFTEIIKQSKLPSDKWDVELQDLILDFIIWQLGKQTATALENQLAAEFHYKLWQHAANKGNIEAIQYLSKLKKSYLRELKWGSTTVYIEPITVEKPPVFMSEKMLSYVLGTALTIISSTTPKDIILMPGRSCIQIGHAIEMFGMIHPDMKRKTYMPAFSAGSLIVFPPREFHRLQEILFEIREDEVAEELADLSKAVSIMKDALSSKKVSRDQAVRDFVASFSEVGNYYYDFSSMEIKEKYKFCFSKKMIASYEEYLSTAISLKADDFTHSTGNVVFIDTILSGAGMQGFMEMIDCIFKKSVPGIANRFSVWNFNCEEEIIPNRRVFFGKKTNNLIVPLEVWLDLTDLPQSSNESSFFPPWAWDLKELWDHTPSEHVKMRYDEIQNAINEYALTTYAKQALQNERKFLGWMHRMNDENPNQALAKVAAFRI